MEQTSTRQVQDKYKTSTRQVQDKYKISTRQVQVNINFFINSAQFCRA